jgi:prepilin-type N-terminal cleavage/methylation domain-containing protein
MVKGGKGFTLVEVMIAIALMGTVLVTLLSALSTASKAAMVADERAAMESLARTEMEYVRSQLYSQAPWNYTVTSSDRSSTDSPSWYSSSKPPLLDSSYAGYTATVSVEGLIDPYIDNEIQEITVTVTCQGGVGTITLKGYRSMR